MLLVKIVLTILILRKVVMEIHKVNITVVDKPPHIANVNIELDYYNIYGIKIMESKKKGIYVKWPQNIKFVDSEETRQISNRILATYVLDHCIDEDRLES